MIKLLKEQDEFRLILAFRNDSSYGSHHGVILSSRERDLSTIISSGVPAREVENLPIW
jgi:hypothetical protein